MAKQTITKIDVRKAPKKRRPGVHSKKKASKSKRAKNYMKRYKGQGK